MKPKLKLYDQVAAAQDKAVRAAENLQQDDDLADELASLSVEEYASRRGWEIVSNPNRSERTIMAATSKATQNLAKRVEELEAENEQLIDDNQYLTEQLDEIRSIATSSLDDDDDVEDEDGEEAEDDE